MLTVIYTNSLFSFDNIAHQPLKYWVHKKNINALLIKFNSITSSNYLSIGKTMNKTSVHIYFNADNKLVDKIVPLQQDSIRMISRELEIDYEKINEVISLLFEAKVNSIKTITVNKVKRIEIFISYNWFSENGKGIVYLPDEHKKSTLKIEKFIYSDKYISY